MENGYAGVLLADDFRVQMQTTVSMQPGGGKEQFEQPEMSYTPEPALQLQWTMRMLASF